MSEKVYPLALWRLKRELNRFVQGQTDHVFQDMNKLDFYVFEAPEFKEEVMQAMKDFGESIKEVDADILQMDREDMVDEIMTLRGVIKLMRAAPKGFKRQAVMDDKTCEMCRKFNHSLVMDPWELVEHCTAEGGCRCVAVPTGE